MTLKNRFLKIILSVSLVLMLTLSWVTDSLVLAEGPTDPAPEIQARGTVNGKKVLFDNTHGQTAGAADWVIDGAFSDFANALADNGYYVKELRKTTPIVLDDLISYDVFVIGEANIPYKTTEQDAILQYIQNGGSVFFIADHYNADRNKNRWDSSEVFNGYRRGAWSDPTLGMDTGEASSEAMQGVSSSDWLSNNFGVRFRYNAIGDVTANGIVTPDQAFGITDGVQTVAMHAGSTVAILDPTKAKGIVYLPETTAAWSYAVDQGVYNGGGIEEGPFVAVSKLAAGKAAFIGDSSPVEDATPKYLREENGSSKTTYNGFLEQDDAILLVNMIDWLATQESYTGFDQVSGLQLDQNTVLYDWELPQNTTEPQTEPWDSPDPGYLWYDQTTFATGSYGADSGSSGGGDTSGSGVFFSEYIEGSSYNKALEIYNGTGSAIDLSAFTIEQSNTSTVLQLNGSLAAGDVYVVAHASAASTILAQADMTTSSIVYNGDDSITLKNNGTVIDVIGTAGVSFAVDKTLVRKSTVTDGRTSYDANEWDTYAKDTFEFLGSHSSSGGIINTPPTVVNPIADQSATVGTDLNVDASSTFEDADGDVIVLSAVSSNVNIATVSVSGTAVTVTPLAEGSATITVTADDGRGGTVDDAFVVTVTQPTSASNELYFSEYIEGSSYNKALEIYNGTGSAIDLSAYTIVQSNTSTVIQLSGTLAAGDVFVIAHSSASSAILANADMTTSSIVYNGDDSVTLKNNGTVIDVIGTAGVTFAQDKTLVRKSTVTDGTASYDANEWDAYAKDTFSFLGSR